MKSKTQIKKQTGRKTNSYLVDTLRAAQKQKAWLPIAARLSRPTRTYDSVNLSMIEEKTKEGDTVLITGKVLGVGDLTKKVRICAMGFTSSAKDKLKKSKSEMISIMEEIKHNPKAQGLKVLP